MTIFSIFAILLNFVAALFNFHIAIHKKSIWSLIFGIISTIICATLLTLLVLSL